MAKNNAREPNFWIVSPNVGNHSQYWSDASVKYKAAFMGYSPNNKKHSQIGHKFAHVIDEGDIVLIARRHHNQPDIVGLGIVVGRFRKHLSGLNPEPSLGSIGSLRLLRPFKRLTDAAAPKDIMRVLRHHKALRQLHPREKSHRIMCNWMARMLHQNQSAIGDRSVKQNDVQLGKLHKQEGELEYKVRTQEKVRLAEKKEAVLVNAYQQWLSQRHHELSVASYKGFRCDAYEKERRNLIEAKCSVKREYIRMAVGQLFDYEYLGKMRLKKPRKAILLPEKPERSLRAWLRTLGIYVIWKEKNKFDDNARKSFT